MATMCSSNMMQVKKYGATFYNVSTEMDPHALKMNSLSYSNVWEFLL